MPLEAATYIDELDPSYPLGTDNVSQGDDHMRMMKGVLQNSLINATYPIDFSKLGSITGSVIMYAGASAPDGYLLCDGSAVSRTTYADLYIAIGTAWGAGDGSTTFNLPSMDDKVPGGVGAHALGAEDGKNTWASSDLPAHTHGLSGGGDHNHTIDRQNESASNTSPGQRVVNTAPGNYTAYTTWMDGNGLGGSHTHTVGSTGSGSDNRQLTAYFNYIIKT